MYLYMSFLWDIIAHPVLGHLVFPVDLNSAQSQPAVSSLFREEEMLKRTRMQHHRPTWLLRRLENAEKEGVLWL